MTAARTSAALPRKRKAANRPTTASPSADPSTAVVAIGDVHGCASLLEETLAPHLGSGVELIFLGDLIDREPEPDGDRKVLERIWQLQAAPGDWGLAGVTVLRGNHEQMLLDALDQGSRDSNGDGCEWMENGGNWNLVAFARPHRDWFAALPYMAIRGNYLFVHAGVRPGVSLKDQDVEDLIWIRQPFLDQPHGLPYTVVHGHTITPNCEIEHLPHRIGLDTGAFFSGRLSALRLSA